MSAPARPTRENRNAVRAAAVPNACPQRARASRRRQRRRRPPRDDRLRAASHREHEIASHPGEVEQAGASMRVSGPMISCTSPPELKCRRRRRSPLPHVARMGEPAEQIAQLRVRVNVSGFLRSGRSSVIVATARRRRPGSGSASRDSRGTRSGGASSPSRQSPPCSVTDCLSRASSAASSPRSRSLTPAIIATTQRSCSLAIARNARRPWT